MSNASVGSVYHRIIEDVIDSCHITFEEEGVDQATLDDLRKTWQKKLSENHVASFPWEPAPVPQPIVNPGPVSNASRPQPLSNGSPAPNIPISSSGSGNVHIKTEPGTGYDLNGLPQSAAPSTYSNPTALYRASQQLNERFGESATTQVNQLQARAALAGQSSQPQRPLSGQGSPPSIEEQKKRTAEQQRQLYEQRRQQVQYQTLQAAQRAAVNNAQTDGTGDWDAMVARRRAEALDGDLKRTEADLTIRQQVEQMSHVMEGGGLMLPLSARSKQPVLRKYKVSSSSSAEAPNNNFQAAQVANILPVSRIAQMDGVDDTDEDDKTGVKGEDDDEDAINSDLDDSDDNAPDDTEEDGTVGNIMLCTYDKVQRVKNKWKCTLKDGVLNTGDKEYVFHKAQGEFEW